MQKESPDIGWFVQGSYGAAFGVLGLFLVVCIWRHYRARNALRRLEHSLEP